MKELAATVVDSLARNLDRLGTPDGAKAIQQAARLLTSMERLYAKANEFQNTMSEM